MLEHETAAKLRRKRVWGTENRKATLEDKRFPQESQEVEIELTQTYKGEITRIDAFAFSS